MKKKKNNNWIQCAHSNFFPTSMLLLQPTSWFTVSISHGYSLVSRRRSRRWTDWRHRWRLGFLLQKHINAERNSEMTTKQPSNSAPQSKQMQHDGQRRGKHCDSLRLSISKKILIKKKQKRVKTEFGIEPSRDKVWQRHSEALQQTA